MSIKRGSDTIIPGGNDELKLYDLAYFMTTRNYIPYIRKIVGKEHYVDRMWNYEKRLEYPVNITTPNPKIAQIIMSQYGGPEFHTR